MKNILVTGGAGFIGSHLVDRLLAEGAWRVTALDDFNDFYSPEIKRRNVSAHLRHESYELVEADIRDSASLRRVFDEEESANCEFDVPLVDGDRAAVSWHGQTKLVDGGTEDLIGVSLLRFDADGLVTEQCDIWVGR